MSDLIRDYVQYGFDRLSKKILDNIDDVQFKSDYFAIDYSNCTTVDGATPNLPCIFPFEFEGSEYDSCIPSGCFIWNGKSWRGNVPSQPAATECGHYICLPCKRGKDMYLFCSP